MPRAFIPNIDDANAEITRLDAAAETHAATITTLTTERDTARGDLATANATITQLRTDLQTAQAAVTTLTGERDTARSELATANTNHARELAQKEGEVTRRLAQAGLTTTPPPVAPPGSPAAGLTGLQRAIAANAAAQATK